MTLPTFIAAVDKLVEEWKGNIHEPNAVPRAALKTIYDDVREQSVHDLAVAVQQRDDALAKLHRHYLSEVVQIIKTTGKPKAGRPPKLK